eukprot:756877-Hanusia_phi.AAC.1
MTDNRSTLPIIPIDSLSSSSELALGQSWARGVHDRGKQRRQGEVAAAKKVSSPAPRTSHADGLLPRECRIGDKVRRGRRRRRLRLSR